MSKYVKESTLLEILLFKENALIVKAMKNDLNHAYLFNERPPRTSTIKEKMNLSTKIRRNKTKEVKISFVSNFNDLHLLRQTFLHSKR
jgi:hypothetical protein